MKLRILDDSLRIRLERSELKQLMATGTVERRIRFGEGIELTYALRTAARVGTMRATFNANRIEVLIDTDQARAWARSNQVSLESMQAHEGGSMRILIEKDFPCHHCEENDLTEKFTSASLSL